MPSKKKKYNARFPAGRIKKIMQSDEEIGKVAQAVPVIISRTLELFVESLLTKTMKITNSRNAKTLSTSHMKQCIMAEQRFDFLRELVKNIPDISVAEEAASYNEDEGQSSPEEHYPDSDTPYDLSMPSTSMRALRSTVDNGPHFNKQSSQNGPDINMRSHLKRESDIILRLQQRVRIPTSSASHSTSKGNSNTHCLPPKLLRSDSTPVNTIQQSWQDGQQSRHLKHQPQSAPGTDSHAASSKKNQECRPSPSQPAIPAPIVSFDFCNKPVVKIDYSNITIPTKSPYSASDNFAATQPSSSGFDFSAEPIINIDLSNIVPNTATLPIDNNSAVATISIGAFASTSMASMTKPQSTITQSKSLIPVPFRPGIPSSNLDLKSSKNPFFELDEDYDNI